MNEENRTLALEALTDFLNACEAGIEAARQTIKKVKRLDEPSEKSTVNVASIKWLPAEGPRGVYEKSIDLQNPEFQALLAQLTEHHGFMDIGGMYYWSFSGSSTGIGRKPRQKK